MLAVVTVNTGQDIVNPSDQLTSLREAIQTANDLEGADEIVFDFGHKQPVTITLEHGEFDLTDAVTITGPGRELLTIDARQHSIFNFSSNQGNFTIRGLTLTGGGVFSDSEDMLTIVDSTVTNNQFERGRGAVIGAFNGDVTIRSSTISGNGNAQGTWPASPIPGIVWSGNDVTVISSTISQNSTSGIRAGGDVTVISSTISGNRGGLRTTLGGMSLTPGGISAGGDVDISSSTISGNAGGGVSGGWGGNVAIRSSTIAGNLNIRSGLGIGVRTAYGNLVVENSIVAHNSGGDLENDPYDPSEDVGRQLCLLEGGTDCPPEPSSEPTWTVRHSLIGHNRGTPLVETPLGHPDSDGNLVGGPVGGVIDPRLGPLADNGGPTLTHALLPDSPAINVGDPSAVIGGADVPRFDQRGEPYRRLMDGRLDMGAIESRPVGDSNGDGLFDSSDLMKVFQAGKYEDDFDNNANFDEGDWNGDGDFDTSDLVFAFQTGNYVSAATPLAAAVDQLFLNDRDEHRAARADLLTVHDLGLVEAAELFRN